MSELVLNASTLPMPLFRLIPTEKVRIREDSGEIRLIPVNDVEPQKQYCPFIGLYNDGKLTVDGYLARKRMDKELER
jgi:hypothetical protein